MFKVVVVFFTALVRTRRIKHPLALWKLFTFFFTFSSLNHLNARPLENKNNMAPWHAAPNELSLLLITFLYLKTAKNTY